MPPKKNSVNSLVQTLIQQIMTATATREWVS